MRAWLNKLWQQLGKAHRKAPAPSVQSWHRPGTYSVWTYDAPDFNGPILVLGLEWAIGDLRGVRACGAWLHEDDTRSVDDNDFTSVRGEFDNQDTFAHLIATGELLRIGPIPASDRYYASTD
jgi:hypothetical protein